MVDGPAENTAGGAWRAVGASVAGATHVRAGIPNQDSLYLPPPAAGLPLIVAVSDGHGSPKCFRSHLGSRFAVGAAAVSLQEFLDGAPAAETPDAAEERARTSIPAAVARRWSEAVRLDLKLTPLEEEELAKLADKSGPAARAYVEANPLLAYGATILAAAIVDRAIVFAQLGDGEILAVSETKEVAKPLADDARLFADETTSLSSPSAAKDFRVKVLDCSASYPALVLLTTDGYANSFRDDAAFVKVGADVYDLIAETSLDAVGADVKGWLEEATRLGSGDDVTLAIVCRTNAIRAATPPPEQKKEETPDEDASDDETTTAATTRPPVADEERASRMAEAPDPVTQWTL